MSPVRPHSSSRPLPCTRRATLPHLALVPGALVLTGLVLVAGGCRAFGGGRKGLAESDLTVRVRAAAKGDVQVRLDEVGTIEPVVKVDVKATLSGRVVELLVREGDIVTAGQPLARIEPDVNQAQELANVRSRKAKGTISLADAQREYARQEQLFQEGYTSHTSYDQAKARYDQAVEEDRAAREQVAIAVESGIPLTGEITPKRLLTVTSPMAGTVIARPVQIGETITSGVSSFNAGSVLYTVADLSAMLVKADVNEVDIGHIAMGQTVEISLDAFPFQHFTGKVTFLSPAAKVVEKVKVFNVEVTPDGSHPEFRPGMTANLSIVGEARHDVLAIPTEALFRRDGKDVVFVLRQDFSTRSKEALKAAASAARGRKADLSPFWKDLFESRPVSVGLSAVESTEILSGLQPSEKVATDDPAKPPPESN